MMKYVTMHKYMYMRHSQNMDTLIILGDAHKSTNRYL